MIVDLPDTTTSKISKKIMALREQGGVIASRLHGGLAHCPLLHLRDLGRHADHGHAVGARLAEHPLELARGQVRAVGTHHERADVDAGPGELLVPPDRNVPLRAAGRFFVLGHIGHRDVHRASGTRCDRRAQF